MSTSSGTLTLTMGSTEWENFCIAVRARVSTQAAVTAGAFTYPILAAGEMFKLPHVNITAATIAGKVEGVDFKIMKNSGFITALTDNLALEVRYHDTDEHGFGDIYGSRAVVSLKAVF